MHFVAHICSDSKALILYRPPEQVIFQQRQRASKRVEADRMDEDFDEDIDIVGDTNEEYFMEHSINFRQTSEGSIQ